MPARVSKPRSAPEPEVEVEATPATAGSDAADVDDLLAEIDDVLEENAQAFVAAFVQKGGQ